MDNQTFMLFVSINDINAVEAEEIRAELEEVLRNRGVYAEIAIAPTETTTDYAGV